MTWEIAINKIKKALEDTLQENHLVGENKMLKSYPYAMSSFKEPEWSDRITTVQNPLINPK